MEQRGVSFINQTSSAAIEQIVNRLLSLDVEAGEQLKTFSNKIIHIRITDLDLDYYLVFPNGSLVVQSNIGRAPSASISGKLSAFIASATSDNKGDAIFNGDLHFSGEVNTARQFQQFAQSLEIDWQEPLSRVCGDLVGHTLATGFKQLTDLTRSFLSNARQDIPEYLQEEIQVTPPAAELEVFYQSIGLLRSQTDRLQARIERLSHHD